jgi:hypothetical protein
MPSAGGAKVVSAAPAGATTLVRGVGGATARCGALGLLGSGWLGSGG